MSETLDTDRPTPQATAADAATALPGALAGPSDPTEGEGGTTLALNDFITEFGAGLLTQVRAQNPPIDDGIYPPARDAVIDQLLRKPFDAQRRAVQAVCKLLLDHGAPAGIINAEMGTGKTMMAIAAAAVLHACGYERTIVISPPHLVYKWRREIRETVPDARVWILNGPDTLRKLIALRAAGKVPASAAPEFFILGRVRMRMGFHWRPAFVPKATYERGPDGLVKFRAAACPRCGTLLSSKDDDGHVLPLSAELAAVKLADHRSQCDACGEALWTLMRPGRPQRSFRDLVSDALQQMPTIGAKTADRLLATFGEDLLGSMLGDNVYEFLYLMDEKGDLVFSDRQAARMERALAGFEFSFGEGGYQPTEFIKRYLPRGYFGLLVVDEGHEYKNQGSAQGQAMGVLASQCRKALLLTGTLMGGYADDLFHLLWRLDPAAMIEDGFRPSTNGSMGAATMAFMREHGVLKDVFKETVGGSHRTAKGQHITHRTSKAPGFGPKGIMRYVLPVTVFLKLRDIGQKVLPPYEEIFTGIAMSEAQAAAYNSLKLKLVAELRKALAMRDSTLLGVVLNVLLAWPDCCFRPETVVHPRSRKTLAMTPAIFADGEPSPKELALLRLCADQKAKGRRFLIYSVYSGTRDTTQRLKTMLDERGFKTAVLRASVEASRREDWVAEQLERGIDGLICNPELVKTGLDLLEFPTLVYMQTGFNVYTVQQASRRSWRIGQKLPVEVHFLGYEGSAQLDCLSLMAKKIAVSQSTSGDMPDSGLDVLNQGGDAIEVALAKQLIG